MVKSSPGVNPKPRFGPILDSTEWRCFSPLQHTHASVGGWVGRVCRPALCGGTQSTLPRRRVGGQCVRFSKALALIWYRALTWCSSPARPFAAPDDPLLVTGQQGSPFPAYRQLFRARNACAGSSSEESTKLKHGTKLGPTLC